VTPLAYLRLAGWIVVAAALLSAGWAGAWHWRGAEVEHLRGERDRAHDAVTALGGQIADQNARVEQWLRARVRRLRIGPPRRWMPPGGLVARPPPRSRP
jgi:hypothetical protein